MSGDGNHQDQAHRPHLARDFAALRTRITAQESAPRTFVVTHDAGGEAWTSANDAWIAPGNVPPWTELRLRNTDAGPQIYRALPDTAGNIWQRTT